MGSTRLRKLTIIRMMMSTRIFGTHPKEFTDSFYRGARYKPIMFNPILYLSGSSTNVYQEVIYAKNLEECAFEGKLRCRK